MSTNEESSGTAAPGVRRVTEREADRVTELFTLAFYDDPTWSCLSGFRQANGPTPHLVGPVPAQRPSVRMGLDDRRWRRCGALDPAR
jgi:hypothetical protein